MNLLSSGLDVSAAPCVITRDGVQLLPLAAPSHVIEAATEKRLV